MSEKEEITALVIRLRLYLALEKNICKAFRQYMFAVEVLNISEGRGQNIISKNPRIKHLTKTQCIKELKEKSPIMLKVAMIDND